MSLRGNYWELTHDQCRGVVPDCRGVRYIALLVRHANSGKGPIHAKELAALATGSDAGAVELELTESVLDTTAKAQLLSRLEEIAGERERAISIEDFDRATALDNEYEQIAEELSRARAPRRSGRDGGSFAHAGEKARKAVAKAIAEGIARIAAHPDLSSLAEHLSAAIRKGQWLSYTGSIDWHVEFRTPPPRK